MACDPPKVLVEKMIRYLAENGGQDADVVFVAGDLVSHKIA